MNDEPTLKVHASGIKMWYLHGKLHHADAPAIEYADGAKEWWLHGKVHRMHGAAIEYASGDKSWYLHGKRFDGAEAWAEKVLQMQNKPCDAANVDAFLKQILKQNVDESL